MQVCLVSIYDMGRQPFGLASPAAWLREAGAEVVTLDLAREPFSRAAIEQSDWVAFHLPMHTATRLALPQIETVRRWNPSARLACYGLYAPVNAEMLRGVGIEAIIGGEFERALVDVVFGRGAAPEEIVLDRLPFRKPDRSSLPPLAGYARLRVGSETKTVGYTEASRGCKHLCRHCPIVPVYNGRFRIIPREIVLADVRQQVDSGAEHITFGDPDFLNGPGHAIPILEALHAEFPGLTYDVTIKVEHLLKHRESLPVLARTGCAFITSAVESIDDAVLGRFDKGHTREDFIHAVRLVRANGLVISPTFVTFHPWTTRAGYQELLRTIRDLHLIANVAPIQWAIRLLIPAGSRLLELEEVRRYVSAGFDSKALSYSWKHPDPSMDKFCTDLQRVVKSATERKVSREGIFRQIWQMAHEEPDLPDFHLPTRATVPYLTEPWYC